jgi:palmitoyltransferase
MVAQIYAAAALGLRADVHRDCAVSFSNGHETVVWIWLAVTWAAFVLAHRMVWRSPPGWAAASADAGDCLIGVRDGDIHPTTQRRWCLYCEHWQPLRAKHCDMCGKCILRFDHHCFWVSTCIGQNNHPAFVSMLLADTVFTVTAASMLSAHIEVECGVGWNAFVGTILAFAVAMAVMVAGLLLFHVGLVVTGTTTWEAISGSRITYLRRGVSRFNLGPWRNLHLFVRPPADWSEVHGSEIEHTLC